MQDLKPTTEKDCDFNLHVSNFCAEVGILEWPFYAIALSLLIRSSIGG
ncbi:MAG: hypothetical protein JETT_0670 [Candidatus Jettenia ecosi]|uniref:Uncharacterized protein n=1 Tax=Candidatus Jettenia ecosi TaxID=2494326 RepID=A0A533QE07_9BACT|nr:MAG: hypothetical protein JETT_0670 [Candidatus Jettenia ecosi]